MKGSDLLLAAAGVLAFCLYFFGGFFIPDVQTDGHGNIVSQSETIHKVAP